MGNEDVLFFEGEPSNDIFNFGYYKICLVFKNIQSIKAYKLKNRAKVDNIYIEYGINNKIKELKKVIDKKIFKIYDGDELILASKTKKVDLILAKNKILPLDQIICKQMQINGKKYGVAFSTLISNNKNQRKILFKNINLCKKFKIPIILSCFSYDNNHIRSPTDYKSVLKNIQRNKT